jgi:alkanesulfonate monooxygenase SsuD/methylene tetrahydromethanopterin reductase-like flavin-dependent oxidoreductase (luciferase family)
MEFGVQFFPSVGPDLKSAEQYWGEALQLTQLAEQLGYANVRTVEHYFHPYGGYSPDPLIFLSAAAAITRKIRLITGAVLPVFNNPLNRWPDWHGRRDLQGPRGNRDCARLPPA